MMPMRPVATRANLSAASIASAPEFPNEIRVKGGGDRKSTRLNSSHSQISYAVFCLKKKKIKIGHEGEANIVHKRVFDRVTDYERAKFLQDTIAEFHYHFVHHFVTSDRGYIYAVMEL